ncbi:MAG: hypothetical protein JWL64_332, partial [Frankiales bacterium]|nr:hypothetical protein [Frankiales bacterium]
VVGNDSGGGLVLLALGGKAPGLSRLGRLVLTNCDSYDHLPPKAFGPLVRLCRRVPRAGRLILRGLLHTRAGQRQFLGSVCRRTVPGGRRAALFGTPGSLDDAVRVTAALAPDPDERAMTWLARVTLPVDLVWGVDDRFFPKSDAVRLAAAMPQATTTWVEHAKTYVQLDDPASVARAVLAPQE